MTSENHENRCDSLNIWRRCAWVRNPSEVYLSVGLHSPSIALIFLKVARKLAFLYPRNSLPSARFWSPARPGNPYDSQSLRLKLKSWSSQGRLRVRGIVLGTYVSVLYNTAMLILLRGYPLEQVMALGNASQWFHHEHPGVIPRCWVGVNLDCYNHLSGMWWLLHILPCVTPVRNTLPVFFHQTQGADCLFSSSASLGVRAITEPSLVRSVIYKHFLRSYTQTSRRTRHVTLNSPPW